MMVMVEVLMVVVVMMVEVLMGTHGGREHDSSWRGAGYTTRCIEWQPSMGSRPCLEVVFGLKAPIVGYGWWWIGVNNLGVVWLFASSCTNYHSHARCHKTHSSLGTVGISIIPAPSIGGF